MGDIRYPNSQANPAAATPVWIAPPPAAAGFAVENIPANAGTVVKEGAGTFMGLSVNTPGTNSVAKVYDGEDNTGVLLGTFSTAAVNSWAGLGWGFTDGLFVETTGDVAADITVQYI